MLTGYQEFEYARTAIQFGVRDYILKPIDYEKLEQTVRKIAESLLAERAEQMKKETQWDKVAHLAYEKILYDVLMGHSASGEHHLIPLDNQDADDLMFTFLLVEIEGYSQISVQWTERERKLWNFAVGNVLKEALLPFQLKYSAVQIREGEWCVLIELHHDDAFNASLSAQSWLQTLKKAVSENVKLSISVGAYPGTVSFDGLSDAYKNMQKIMLQPAGSNRNFSGTEKNLENQESALSKKTSELFMISAKEYIHRCLSTDFGVEEVADHLGISNSYFSLLFKAHFGETFVEYVTKQRMEQAKSMLRTSDKSIAKICALVGYAERRYFTKVFQKYTGMTPSDYREANGGVEARRYDRSWFSLF
jgi:YesN/AraC family two-component response regulator